MIVKSWPLKTKYRTVWEVKYATNEYFKDLLDFPTLSNMDIEEYFDYVKKIPYTKDAKNVEVVSRPKYLLNKKVFPALDCKKKAILMGSFMLLKHGPESYRFIISSNRPDKQIGHIFTQINIDGSWINADATYAQNQIGKTKKITAFEIMGN